MDEAIIARLISPQSERGCVLTRSVCCKTEKINSLQVTYLSTVYRIKFGQKLRLNIGEEIIKKPPG